MLARATSRGLSMNLTVGLLARSCYSRVATPARWVCPVPRAHLFGGWPKS